MAATTVFTSLASVFTGQIQAVVFVGALAMLSMVVFLFIDWNILIQEKCLKIVKPEFRKQ